MASNRKCAENKMSTTPTDSTIPNDSTNVKKSAPTDSALLNVNSSSTFLAVDSKGGKPNTEQRKLEKKKRIYNRRCKLAQQDPEFRCVCITVHSLVALIAIICVIMAIPGAVERYISYADDDDRDARTLVAFSIFVAVLVANVVLFVGNRFKIKSLYYVYLVIMLIALIVMLVLLYFYLKMTIDVLEMDPRRVGDEEMVWYQYRKSVERLLTSCMCYMFIVMHAMIFYVVRRDFRYVREYPNWQNAMKELTADESTTKSRSKSMHSKISRD
ncbi:unnamed protein product [Bursaphelenchus okinawaensis]|uniref:Uncharacterized protein n=1 Tax=Bursaphelenchus okinawaensis TaxID=465554 RepID=A0A811L249_9BILA|nr:unnamed protein product [Bursaphelenchus okinawaensis]CAG9117306.1 unnamed protein product [Bursaphelenchus okinawaensis]